MTAPLIRKVTARRGWHWLVEGFGLFRRSPLIWIVFTMILFLAAELVARVPVLGVVLLLFYPVILAGLMVGCADLERGEPLEIGHLFAGLRRNPVHLTTIGGVYLVGQMVIMWVMSLIGGEQMQLVAAGMMEQADPEALAAALGAIMQALLIGAVLSVPLLMAMWFSPLLVVFDKLAPLPALKLSMQACWKNMTPFLVYGVVALALMIALMLPFGMANPQANPGIWIALPVLLPSLYASYRDVFGAAAGEPPAPPAADGSV
jgi:uncharacterized membrane protein